MDVINTVNAAKKHVFIRCVVLRNPYFKRVLFVGSPADLPPQLCNKHVTSHLYDPNKQRLILRVHA